MAQVWTLKGSHGGERQRFKPVCAEVAFGNHKCKFLGLMPRGPDSEGLGWVREFLLLTGVPGGLGAGETHHARKTGLEQRGFLLSSWLQASRMET